MISYLAGRVLEKSSGLIVLNVNGVGYKVFVTNSLVSELELGNPVEVWTYMAVRENAQDLYGFDDKSELEMFKLLLTISGIGPKSALSILNSATVQTLTEGISSGDASYLSKVSGISKKNAEKIVINLKNKLGVSDVKLDGKPNQNAVAIDALVALGYSERESREAISGLDKNDNPEMMIKEALKKLNS